MMKLPVNYPFHTGIGERDRGGDQEDDALRLPRHVQDHGELPVSSTLRLVLGCVKVACHVRVL